jgi:hypothetical protein
VDERGRVFNHKGAKVHEGIKRLAPGKLCHRRARWGRRSEFMLEISIQSEMERANLSG